MGKSGVSLGVIDTLINKHIGRLQGEIAERLETIKRHNLGANGFEAQLNRDDAKKIALLREGVIPKYSDLPAGEYGNNLPAVEMFEFSDIHNETAAATRDLDLIQHGMKLGKSLSEIGDKYRPENYGPADASEYPQS